MKIKDIIANAFLFLTVTTVQAQITISGNVFGGARQADVNGNGSVTIHGATANTDMITIKGVFGGNDISGTVQGGHTVVTTDGGNQLFIGQLFGGGNGDYEYTKVLETDSDAGGHVGKYRMTHLVWDKTTNKWITEIMGYVEEIPDAPEIKYAAINLKAGTFGYVYGGGNAATVTNEASITIDIPNTIAPLDINGDDDDANTNTNDDLISDADLQSMGINTEFFAQNGEFHISRLFGGNNKAVMAIQPSWHLNKGKIENLYSGGNEGSMTSETGLLLEINPQVPEGTATADIPALMKQLAIENVFGGCRKADVDPRYQSGDNKGERVEHVEPPASLLGYNPPRDFAARVRVFGGDINNIYGGNDVSGHVYFGNSVGVYTSIRGNIYGGGNGSYAYTDNVKIKEKFPLRYGDFYYDVNHLLGLSDGTTITGMNSAKALNLFRPDAEQVSILVSGSEGNPTIIGGSIYCGGNSATLKIDENKVGDNDEYPNYPIVELKVGSYVVANEVFLGNNGADMVKKKDEAIEDCVLYKYAHGVDGTSGEISKSSDAAGWLDYSKMQLASTTPDSETNRTQFDEYMEGCAMGMVPRLVFNTGYKGYSTYIGSLYCGGNVGSMTVDGLISIPFNDEVVIFEKLVGGCNNANVDAIDDYNIAYYGGLTGTPDADTGNKLELTFNGLKIQPKRRVQVLDDDGYPLEWNTVDNTDYDTTTDTFGEVPPVVTNDFSGESKEAETADLNRRLLGGNIYGGCYDTGHVNGNVVINLDATIVDRKKLFDEVETDDLGEEESLYGDNLLEDQPYMIKQRHTGVILGQQGMDVLGKSLNVFGGGYGAGSEIWGSTTINLNRGYAFQIFGGGESGAIGRRTWNSSTNKFDYTYNPKYSCFINLRGTRDGKTKQDDIKDNAIEETAESEFIYGGGFFGTIAGNTVINLGKGRVFNTFGGSCNADILGHTETYIGRQVKTGSSKDMLNHYLVKDATTGEVKGFKAADDFYEGGFPYIRDIVYGGNDLGGEILGESSRGADGADCNFKYRVHESTLGLVHNPGNKSNPDVLTASAYVEYTQGRADAIFGGCFGTYDYTDPHYGKYFYATGGTGTVSDPKSAGYNLGSAREGYTKPRMNNAFVNFRPVDGITSAYNWVKEIYGAGQGYPGDADRDKMQNRSYVLIDIPQEMTNYQDNNLKIFGAGAWGGLGMGVATATYYADKDKGSAIIDLVSGKVGSAYGASYKEGFTRRTVVNVPGGITVGEGDDATTLNSTIDIQKIFGGGEGVDEEGYRNTKPCDAYEANVNYSSPAAIVRGAIYGGNNAYRRTLYGKVNINAPVHNGKTDLNDKLMTTTVYGAGCGENTWSQYTEVNLNPGAEVYEVYGGGERGKVYNKASVDAWKASLDDLHTADETVETISLTETTTGTVETNPCFDNGLNNVLAIENEDGSKHNTNVHIHEGAIVNNYYITKKNNKTGETYPAWDGGYAYGGGLGTEGIDNSGDVYGTTYIDLLGGTVVKDLYAAGTQGSVMDLYGTPTTNLTDDFGDPFVASSNAFIKGGTVRNVYGGGWAGSVGRHAGVPREEPVLDEEGNPVEDEDGNPMTQTVMDYLIASYDNDVPGETYVVIGTPEGSSFTNGLPAIERNAYGGGEGGAVWGTTHLTMNNGYIGYRHFNKKADALADAPDCGVVEVDGSGCYQEKLHDETWYGDQHNRLYDSGCLFGGGYIDNSSVDHTEVRMYGGTVRNSLFGGGEIAAIGRGTVTGIDKIRTLTGIYKAGSTLVGMHDGWVKRNVFGGGRGYNNLGENGKLFSDGYVFGHTEVHIHGGEIGTDEGVARGEGNVFGGGDIGYVYSAYEDASGHLAVGQKSGTRYDDGKEGYFYKFERETGQNLVYNTGTKLFTGGKFVEGYPLTEDCKVLIEPECRVKADNGKDEDNNPTPAVTINSHGYYKGEYVPIDDLNTMGKKSADNNWKKLDDDGIIIHNAVFAGGNVSSGNANAYANVSTVFGNATASIHDVYHCDLITIGTGHTGGLYGDGNLTFVDGYRGLNITNYGTDYYSIAKEISQKEYEKLPKREQAYYELRYKYINATPTTDSEGREYHREEKDGQGNVTKSASTISLDELLAVFEGTDKITEDDSHHSIPNPIYWEENGVCSRYAGRIMNTIQRADFCGVFGSRMVLQGAPDRVVETVSKNYTINRVREVSLNHKDTERTSDTGEDRLHGNYFGIYNVVNNLGNLTSDVQFGYERANDGESVGDIRTTDNSDETTYKCTANGKAYNSAGATFYNWKKAFPTDRRRNNGNSHNQVALASGVYLEIKDMDIREKNPTSKDGDEWGYITGVVELDLINVQPGIGGGFVYAKNEHRKLSSYVNNTYATLTALNATAVTRKDYTYMEDVDANKVEWETSGNFVHSTQVIIDDCYPKSNMYKGEGAMKAHYWYIKGEVYVYDQYITAYTGTPNAYSETVDIPLTITAASNGVMKLLNVQPNLYAYYSSYTGNPDQGGSGVKLAPTGELEINNVKYHLNDPISYWDWYMLSKAEQRLFVPETYVTIAPCIIGDGDDAITIEEGFVMIPGNTNGSQEGTYYYYKKLADEKALDKKKPNEKVKAVHAVKKTGENTYEPVVDKDGDYVYNSFDYIFRESNNMRHETGYILTYKVDNPLEWNSYYMKNPASSGSEPWRTDKTLEDKSGDAGYHSSPTYRYIGEGTGELLGQRDYEVGNLISQEVYQTYQTAKTAYPSAIPADQATFYPAYIMKDEVDDVHKTVNGELVTLNLYPGAAVAEEEFSADDWAKISPHKEAAYISPKTITLSETEYISLNMKMGQTELDSYLTSDKYTTEQKAEIIASVMPAYYCTVAGSYGGDYYAKGTNYRALAAWSSMSEADRAKFEFNYDAFDLLIDKDFGLNEGRKYQYDGNSSFNLNTATDAQKDQMIYSLEKPVDYQATYKEGNTTGDYHEDPTDESSSTYRGMSYTDASAGVHIIRVGQELTRTEYEAIPNEQRHYAPITIVKDNDGNLITEYYVVNTAFFYGDSNYPVGTVITESTFEGLLSEYQPYVTKLTFDPTKVTEGDTYYYCREPYNVDEKGEGVDPVVLPRSILTDGNVSWSSGTVPVGFVISNYSSLPNKQKDFVIHGKSPVETSTLFVSRNSDIFDLSKEKIITVVYQYDYDESDASKNHITPIQERHVVNIHITFKSGVPTVEDISTPKIVMPGTGVSMKEPYVSPGAYEVTGGGWELFEDIRDAETHTNGIEYRPGTDPLYWYQDGFYLAYYAKTYLGKTYSNEVQVSVANSHDLKKVMDAKTHHYYIDKSNVKRDPKIYINDYSSTSENGLDILKSLFDLSLLDDTKVNTDANGLITTIKTADPEDEETTDSPFKGHALLKDRVKAAQNLEFFLRSNINHTGEWTPIGNDNAGECFQGTLHGDGYYISGLDNTLFAYLCGNVYNLGVTGSFTGAGVAEKGSGFVENCWISTNTTEEKTSKPVFDEPTTLDPTRPLRIVNCYYQEEEGASNNYTNHTGNYGIPIPKNKKAFYNGEVAYDLNGFYLYKRYRDNNSGLASATDYWFFKDNNFDVPVSASYGTDGGAYCSSGTNLTYLKGYVEDRFADGDFIYANGIPDDVNKRLYVPTSTTSEIPSGYYPIWPDDYIFFGQRLNFGHDDDRPHQDVPSAIVKSPVDPDRILTLLYEEHVDKEDATKSILGNRVNRAPAYFRNGKMNVAYFNPNAVFAQTKKGDATVIAYKNMTAIDFTGGNSDVEKGYQFGSIKAVPYDNEKMADGAFFPPLLDDDGLVGFKNVDLTKNLLVYTGKTAPASATTDGVVESYLPDVAYVETNSTYKTAKEWDRFSSKEKVYGHRVELTSEGYVAQNDHFLMDKEDFDAPIGYSFAGDGDPETDSELDKRMWYQREPGDPDNPENDGLNYVGWKNSTTGQFIGSDSGWEGISLPFTVDLVTTEDKGEITHFYKDSRSVSNSGSKTGHEYWLREFTGGTMSDEAGKENVLKADMRYPGYGNDDITGVTKKYTNTFLWDYYYSYNNYDDANYDNYQEKEDNSTYYYKGPHTYDNYLRLANGTPYIIGFPGERYYEFDLSGKFSPKNTSSWDPSRNVKAQHIIFSSKPGETTIAVSDTEKAGVTKTVTKGGKEASYTFTPSYLNDPELETGKYAFLLNTEGNSYVEDKLNTTVAKVSAFRPYFKSTEVATSGGGNARAVTRSIVFSNEDSQLQGVEEKGDPNSEDPGKLKIYAGKHKIVVESALTRDIEIRIVNTAGITVNTFTLEPGETVETRIINAGVYIVQSTDGRYIKKLAVK